MVLCCLSLVYKVKEKPAAKEEPEEKPQQRVFIPVVGENDEPELKPTGQLDGQKRKMDHGQMATDDYHYDKFKKRVKRF